MGFKGFMTSNRSDHSHRIVPAVLILCVALIGTGVISVITLAPFLVVQFDVTMMQAMYATALFGLGASVSGLGLGWVIDEYGYRKVVVVAMSAYAATLISCALSINFSIFVVLNAFLGLITGVLLPSIYSYASCVSIVGLRKNKLSFSMLGWAISFIFGASAISGVAEFFGWRWAYVILAISSMVAVYFLKGQPAEERIERASSTFFYTLRLPDLKRILLILLFFVSSFYGVYSYTLEYSYEQLEIHSLQGGIVPVFYGLGYGLGVLVFYCGNNEIFSRNRLMSLFVMVALVIFSFGWLKGSWYGLLGGIFVWGFLNSLVGIVINVKLASLSFSSRGSVLGLSVGVNYFSLFLSTLFMGWLKSLLGFDVVIFMGGALCIFAGGLSLRLIAIDRFARS